MAFHPPLYVPTAVVSHQAEVGVRCRSESRCFLRRGPMVGSHGVVARDAVPTIAHSAVAHIKPTALDDGSRELHPMLAGLKIDLVGMQFEMEFFSKIAAQQRNGSLQPLLVIANQDEIIHIATIELEAQAIGHILVEIVHIEVGEQLRSEVAYGQAQSSAHAEQRLVLLQAVPVAKRAVDDATHGGVVVDNLAAEPRHDSLVAAEILFLDEMLQLPFQQRLVDVHEETSNVEFQHVCILGVMFAALVNELCNTPYAIQSAFPSTAAITVVDEKPLEKGIEAADDIVMHDTVAEVGCKHLAQLGPAHHKGDAWPNLVAPLVDFVAKLDKIVLIIQFELQSTLAVALCLPTLQIGLKQVFQPHLAVGILHEKGK